MSELIPFDPERVTDVITMGRAGVNLYAEQLGSSLEDVQSFKKYIGGVASNVAIGCARLGMKSAIYSCVGTDAMGRFAKKSLVAEGVNTAFLQSTDQHLTAVMLLSITHKKASPLIFYRENCADMQLQPEHIDETFLKDSKSLLLSGNSLSTASQRLTAFHAVKLAKKTKTAVVFDLDFRPVLWGLAKQYEGSSRYAVSDEVTQHYQKMLPKCDLIVGTEDEMCVAGGNENLEQALAQIRNISKAVIVLKMGERGCQVFPDEISLPLTFVGYPVKVLNDFGAGDSFLSGFLCAWLHQESWQRCAELANACGAMVVSRHGCSQAMPSLSEVEYFISHYATNDQVAYQEKLIQLHRQSFNHTSDKTIYLAFDHRWQFEQSCDDVGRERSIIGVFKQQVFSGFMQVAAKFPELNLAIHVDPIYGQDVLQEATLSNVNVSVPVEAAESFPVQWMEQKPIYEQILSRPSSWAVKLLWLYHPDLDPAVKLRQMSQLNLLYSVCKSLDRNLMLELIIPNEFKNEGKYVAKAMEQVYEHGIFPSVWNLTPLTSYSEWKLVGKVLEKNDPTAQLVLVGGYNRLYQDWTEPFYFFKQSSFASGFAIGRSVFWESWQAVLSGEISLNDVPAKVEANFCEFITKWQQTKVVDTVNV